MMANPIALFDNISQLDSQSCKQQLDTFSDSIKAKANKEFNYAIQFLQSYRGSEATFRSYRRELERFFQWSWLVAHKNIVAIKRQDIESFIEFCLQPPKSWIGLAQLPKFINRGGERIPNPEWRPFVATISKKQRADGLEPKKEDFQLSQAAIRAIFATLSSFYNYLIQEEFVDANPVAQIRQKSKFLRKQQSQKQIRRLSELQWAYVIETAQQLAEQEPEPHERSLFILSALYGMYLRISELAASKRWQPEMGHFYRDQYNQWWFKTVGKGNKERDITVSDAMLNALKRYRQYLGLSALPSPGETTPLLPKSRHSMQFAGISDTRYLRRIVQFCFDATVERLKRDGLQDEAEQLMSATVHWLRHTGISDDVKTRPREHVRDDAGHSSGAITDRYIDVELIQRHQSGRKKTLVPDSD